MKDKDRRFDWFPEFLQDAPLARLAQQGRQSAPWDRPVRHFQGECRRAIDWTGAVIQNLKQGKSKTESPAPSKPSPPSGESSPHGLSVGVPPAANRLAGRPHWAIGLEGWQDEEAKINVEVPKGYFAELNCVFKVGLPPQQTFDILTDPSNNLVFKNIKEVLHRKVLVDDGRYAKVEVEQSAIWRFLCFSGTFSVFLEVEQDRVDHWIKFRQARPGGFMKQFEGSWQIEPVEFTPSYSPKASPDVLSLATPLPEHPGEPKGIASHVTLKQIVQPSLIPPPPLDRYIRGITAKTTQDMLRDLQAEAARIRHGKPVESREALRENHPGKEVKRGDLGPSKKNASSTRRKSRLYSEGERKPTAPLVRAATKRKV